MNQTTSIAETDFKPLAPEVKHSGYLMKQVKRTDTVAMYSKGGGFEVITIRKHPGGEMFGKKLDPYEIYPSNEAFGTYGFYYSGPNARERADAKYDALVAAESSKETVAHQAIEDTDAVSESVQDLIKE